MSPPAIVDTVLEHIAIPAPTRILEPSCGNGHFLQGLNHRLTQPADVTAIELDPALAADIDPDSIPPNTTIHVGDFFHHYLARSTARPNPLAEPFDLIVGNPPFGGTFDHAIEDQLDRQLGRRDGRKIKKETYAFFIVACVDLLRDGGQLLFVCSDSLMTIPTMTGLRQHLMQRGDVAITELNTFSDETDYPMVILDFKKAASSATDHTITRNGEQVDHAAIQSTPNRSWSITPELARLFTGPMLADHFIASSGMTTGKNEYFIRELNNDNTFDEPFRFRFTDEPITLAYELERARLGRLPKAVQAALEKAEARADLQRRLRVEPRDRPAQRHFPHPDYAPYNKANGRIIAAPPTHVIYWKDDGDAVLTYKKTANWYLRGVGGQPFFKQQGLTWQLVAARFIPRFLPDGYILDSGAPCAFLRPDTDPDELYFILGWLLAPLATRVLKSVINHTRNIQSKDFERMPYPWWVPDDAKRAVISDLKTMVDAGLTGHRWTWDDPQIQQIGARFEFDPSTPAVPSRVQRTQTR